MKWTTISIILLSVFLLVTTVCAEGTSIILDNDKTTEMSGDVLILCSIIIFVAAILIIVKILLTMGDRE